MACTYHYYIIQVKHAAKLNQILHRVYNLLADENQFKNEHNFRSFFAASWPFISQKGTK
jgi:hypothetical protein